MLELLLDNGIEGKAGWLPATVTAETYRISC